MQALRFRAIFVSDVHLGTRGAQAEFFLDFMRHTESDHLYLVGDILHLGKMRSGLYWPSLNNDIVRTVLHKAHHGTRVIYVPGNHDKLLRDLAGTEICGVHIQQESIHETADGRRLLVLHGDEFDSIIKHNQWLALIGGGAYEVLLVLNRWFNSVRRRCGFPYWSLSTYLKNKVKKAVRYISRFETAVTLEAGHRRVDGLICGHIHKASLIQIGDIVYANSGDWVENCTALVEDRHGGFQILHWTEESTRSLDHGVRYADNGQLAPIE